VDPFSEKLILLVADKILLAGVGAFIAFMASKALERYRRNQTMIVEVAKRQATAFVDVFCGLTECSIHASRIMALARETPPNEEHIENAANKFLEARERLHDKLYAARFLLRYEIGDAAMGVSIEIDEFAKAVVEQAPAEKLDQHLAQLKESLMPFAKHIPELHLPD